MSISEDDQHLDAICCCIASGRRLARLLTRTLRGHQLNEAEFRLLWLLRDSEQTREQCVLAMELGISPAQVSAIVEKLRSQQWITPVVDRSDRRRQFWQLTTTGSEQLNPMIATIELLSRDWATPGLSVRSPLEDAA